MGRLDWKSAASFPPEVNTCRVTGTVVLIEADGSDVDLLPDTDGFIGEVTFTPNLTSQVRVASNSDPVLWMPTTVKAFINSAGQIYGEYEKPGVVLPASLSPNISPRGWTWRVDFKFNGFNKQPVFKPFDIVTPVGDNGGQGEIDLGLVAPTDPDAGESVAIAYGLAAQAVATVADAVATAQYITSAENAMRVLAEESATSAATAATQATNSATSAAASATSAENAHQQLVTNPLELQGVPQAGGKVMVQWRRAGGTWADLGLVDAGADGLSVTGGTVMAEGHLIITLSNNTTLDAGLVRGVKGDKGDAFVYTDFTTAQLEGLRGPIGLTGPPPTLTAGPLTIQDGQPTVNLTGSGGTYTIGMTIPAPAGMTEQAITNLVSQQTDQKFAELEVLALAGL